MNELFWMTVGLIILGLVLALITRNMESKKSSTVQFTVWSITGVVLLLVWLFGR